MVNKLKGWLRSTQFVEAVPNYTFNPPHNDDVYDLRGTLTFYKLVWIVPCSSIQGPALYTIYKMYAVKYGHFK